MMRLKHAWFYVAIATSTAQQAETQQCYYPNGDLAPLTDKPCSAETGSACCPDNWICLDNGLCHYPAQDLYERHSCTDKSWDAPGCPSNLCAYDGQASGAESVTQCSNHSNNWCCNADAQHVDCCQEIPSARPFFALEDGMPFAKIGIDQASYVPTLSTIIGIATSTDNGGSLVTSRPGLSVQVSESTKTISRSITAAQDSIDPLNSSVYAGSVDIKTKVVSQPTSSSDVAPEPSDPAPKGDSSRSQRIALIVGAILGLIIGLAIVRVLVFKCQKQRREQAHPYIKTTDVQRRTTRAKMKHWSMRFLPELEGDFFHSKHSVAPLRSPVELEAGTGVRPPALPSHCPDARFAGRDICNNQLEWNGAPIRHPRAAGRHDDSRSSRNAVEIDGTPVASLKTKGSS